MYLKKVLNEAHPFITYNVNNYVLVLTTYLIVDRN